MARPRVFITGITGMVGSHLVDYLLKETDWEIVGLCRWRSPMDNLSHLVERINAKERISLLYGDLRDGLSIREAVAKARPDYVFHLAAQSFPRTSFDAPIDTMDTNIQGTVRVLDALKEHAPKSIIHVCASSEVFGRVPKEKLPIDEECTFHPASPYAISKVGTDLVGRFLCRGLRHDGDDDTDVHPYRPAARRCLRRIDLRQADRDDRAQLHPAGGQGGQSAVAADGGRRARRGARLLHAGDDEADSRRLLQHRRHALLHGERHSRHPAVVFAAQGRHLGRGRSGSPAADRCRFAGPEHREVRGPYRLETGNPVSRRRCGTCWTIGANACRARATVS